jgi:hypothetical protein
MSSTGHTTTSHPNFQLIIDALANYADHTGIDLSQNAFVEKLEQSKNPDDILKLLQEREKSFKEYRDGQWRLIRCLSPVVRVLHAFSGTLGESLSLVCIFDRCVSLLIWWFHLARYPSHRQRPSLLESMFSSLYVTQIQANAL